MLTNAGRLPAGQVYRHLKRQVAAPAGSFQLTAPVTITQTVIVPPSSTQSSILPSNPALSQASLSSSATTTSSSASPSKTSSSSSPPSTAQSSSTGMATSPSSDKNDNSADSGSQNSGLPPGAIAGVVLAIVLALLALVVFIMRKRLIRHRQQRAEAWKDNLFTKRMRKNSNQDAQFMEQGDAAFSVNSTFAPPMNKAPISRVPVPTVPSTTYNNPPPVDLERSGNIVSMYGGTSPVDGATVISTFIPSLPDELSIGPGETIKILGEYDDGWAMCVNSNGEMGMVPLECLERRNSPGLLVNISRDNTTTHMSRRGSSLTPRR